MPNVNTIHTILTSLYPDAACSLHWGNDPWRLLVMGRLSAQCTDERVNLISPALFAKYPTVEAMAEGDVEEIGALIRSCGFWRAKAESLKLSAQRIVSVYGGKVPDTMEDLLSLYGVGRKIANLVLGDVFGKPGIVADTHCIRINGRLGFYPENLKNPVQVEKILSRIVPPAEQGDYCHRMVLFGREYCIARSPQCSRCPLRGECAHGSALPTPV